MKICIAIAAVLLPLSALAIDHLMIDPKLASESDSELSSDPVAAEVKETEPPKLLTYADFQHTLNGYLWHRSDGKTYYEAYRDYVDRVNAPHLTCSTGHCGTASAGPVKPTGGCNCGCSAGSCNCAHSKNVYLAAARNERASQFNVEPLPTGLPTSKSDVPKETPSISQDVQSLTGLSTTSQSLDDCPSCSMQSRPGLFGRLFGRR